MKNSKDTQPCLILVVKIKPTLLMVINLLKCCINSVNYSKINSKIFKLDKEKIGNTQRQ